jgi:hypothetical protein
MIAIFPKYQECNYHSFSFLGSSVVYVVHCGGFIFWLGLGLGLGLVLGLQIIKTPELHIRIHVLHLGPFFEQFDLTLVNELRFTRH